MIKKITKVLLLVIFFSFLYNGISYTFAYETSSKEHVSSGKDKLEIARKIVKEFLTELQTVLKKQLKEGGPSKAIKVCSEKAPEIIDSIRKKYKDIYLKRTTLKYRNPLNKPTKDEEELLKKLSNMKELPQEYVDTVKIDGKSFVRYVKVLKIKPVCVICHGDYEKMNPKVKKILKKKYPDDRAIGYKPGDFRGITVVKIPIDK